MASTHDEQTRAGEVAVARFESGFSCAEAIVLALAGDGAAGSGASRAAAAFGGGIARRGGTCGALTGCAIAMGLRCGRTSPQDESRRDLVYRAVDRTFRAFQERFGTCDCRRLTGLDFSREDAPDEKARVLRDVCAPAVRFVAERGAAEIAAAEEARVEP